MQVYYARGCMWTQIEAENILEAFKLLCEGYRRHAPFSIKRESIVYKGDTCTFEGVTAWDFKGGYVRTMIAPSLDMIPDEYKREAPVFR